MAEADTTPDHDRVRGHSGSAIDVRLIAKAGMGLGAVLGVILMGVFMIHAGHAGGPEERFGPSASPATAQAFPEPRLQGRPAEDRAHYFAQQRAKAAEYAWVDRERGIVRIPVERAMQLLDEEAANARSAEGGAP